MRIAITGASGPFGQGVTAELLQAGIPAHDLVLITRNPERLNAMETAGAHVRYGDFDDPASLERALEGGIQRLLMISTARVGQREPQHTNAVNAAKTAGVQHLVYTSFVIAPGCVSLAVEDHQFTEQLLKQSGMAWTFLRNSQYAEAMRDAGFPEAIRSGQWISCCGDGRIAMISREDCIRAAAAVLASDGHEYQQYDITGPELVSYPELAELARELSGQPIAYKEVDDAGMYAFFDQLGIPRSARDDYVINGYGWCSDDMVSFGATIRQGGFAVISDDVQRLTGRAPISVRDFLTRERDVILARARAG